MFHWGKSPYRWRSLDTICCQKIAREHLTHTPASARRNSRSSREELSLRSQSEGIDLVYLHFKKLKPPCRTVTRAMCGSRGDVTIWAANLKIAADLGDPFVSLLVALHLMDDCEFSLMDTVIWKMESQLLLIAAQESPRWSLLRKPP